MCFAIGLLVVIPEMRGEDILNRNMYTVPLLFGVLALVLNVVYLGSLAPRTPTRLGKLFSLWLDAKEKELKDRASRK